MQAERAAGAGPYANARLVNSKQKKKCGFVSSIRVLSNRRLWQMRDTVDHKGHLGKLYQELTFTCDVAGCFLGHVLI